MKLLPKDPEILFGVQVQLGLGDLCSGFGMMLYLTCFNDRDPFCVACFRHNGIHYHMPMPCLSDVTPAEMTVVIASNPGRATTYILEVFLNHTTPEQRAKMIQGKDHDTRDNHPT